MATKRKLKNKKPLAKRLRRKSSAPPPAPHIKREPVDPNSVHLVEGKGTSKSGGGPGGHYWHIEVAKKRAGNVFINVIKDDFFGEHPSIQIHLNQSARGRQIGRVAYRLACEQSGYDSVYAHMRKSNIASRRAAEEAGFEVIHNERIPQLSMKWQRKQSTT
ncbi:MAG: hypothetical protein QOH70_4048 [Blastocatellia bacterium]|nr:hypothetical protein [Blastocatellia bacterium]